MSVENTHLLSNADNFVWVIGRSRPEIPDNPFANPEYHLLLYPANIFPLDLEFSIYLLTLNTV